MEQEVVEEQETAAADLQLYTLVEENNALLEQLHQDTEILIASSWLLCGIVIGAAVGQLIYRLWRS